MKLLTLNTHSLAEEDYSRKLCEFAEAVCAESPDVIALQEVNQTASGAEIGEKNLRGYIPCKEGIIICEDNHVYNAARLLHEKGMDYYWTWLPVKRGYGRLDEGIALMSRSPISETDIISVSRRDDYSDWRTRRILGIRTEDSPQEWFYSVHYGWWDDEAEPFRFQWEKTAEHIKRSGRVWLMGDFNNPAEIRRQGYDMISEDGWYDTYLLAEKRDSGITVGKIIDGWRERCVSPDGMRIDFIWCSEIADIRSSQAVFNGEKYPVVSDHYGVLTEYIG